MHRHWCQAQIRLLRILYWGDVMYRHWCQAQIRPLRILYRGGVMHRHWCQAQIPTLRILRFSFQKNILRNFCLSDNRVTPGGRGRSARIMVHIRYSGDFGCKSTVWVVLRNLHFPLPPAVTPAVVLHSNFCDKQYVVTCTTYVSELILGFAFAPITFF